MSLIKIWDLTDPKLPEALWPLRDMFTTIPKQSPLKLSGYEKFSQARDKLKSKLAKKTPNRRAHA